VAIDIRSNEQTKDGTEQTGGMQDQPMFKVDNGDDAKINEHDRSQPETKRFGRNQPKVSERSDRQNLHKPSSRASRYSAIVAPAKSQKIHPGKGSLAV